MVGDPAGEIAGVLCGELLFAGLDIDAIHVEDAFVALVVRHQNVLVIIWQGIEDVRLGAVMRRQILNLSGNDVCHDDVKVLVATEIFRVEHMLRPLEEIVRDVARGFCGDALDAILAAHFFDRLHKNVEPGLVRLHEAERLAIGRNAEIRLFRLFEEIAQRVLLCGLSLRCDGACGNETGAGECQKPTGEFHEFDL